ncbi:hypothetical protein, partial [Pseudomonas paraeruginosa]
TVRRRLLQPPETSHRPGGRGLWSAYESTHTTTILTWREDSEANSGFECFWFDKPAEKGGVSGFVKPCSRKNEMLASEINIHLSDAINQTLDQGNLPFGILDFIIDEPAE